MKLFQKLVCMALTATATASLSICAFAADYTFDTAADTDYYPSTSYEDTYGTAYHYGSKNLVDYQIPELPYGVLSTTHGKAPTPRPTADCRRFGFRYLRCG